jgi:hypothetical protein
LTLLDDRGDSFDRFSINPLSIIPSLRLLLALEWCLFFNGPPLLIGPPTPMAPPDPVPDDEGNSARLSILTSSASLDDCIDNKLRFIWSKFSSRAAQAFFSIKAENYY